MSRTGILLCLAFLGGAIPPTDAQEFSCETLDGGRFTVSEWPFFIITSQSEEDLSESLRCASLISSLESPQWLIDFAWPQNVRVKRMAARSLLKRPFMRSRSTILERPIRNAPLIALVNSNFEVIWSCDSYPSADDWAQALETYRKAGGH